MKKLYRSKQERKIAGVCGGLAEYFQMDPVILRIAFVLVAVLGGIGILVYFVMWMVVPENEGTVAVVAHKRFYLSDRDRKIAGVCGGLGEFFNLDPVIFRIIFVVLIFAGGLGLLLYFSAALIAPRKVG